MRVRRIVALCILGIIAQIASCSDHKESPQTYEKYVGDIAFNYNSMTNGQFVVEIWTDAGLYRVGEPIGITIRISPLKKVTIALVKASLLRDGRVVAQLAKEIELVPRDRDGLLYYDSRSEQHEFRRTEHVEGAECVLQNAFENCDPTDKSEFLAVGKYKMVVAVSFAGNEFNAEQFTIIIDRGR
jgi:hypothetical protein